MFEDIFVTDLLQSNILGAYGNFISYYSGPGFSIGPVKTGDFVTGSFS